MAIIVSLGMFGKEQNSIFVYQTLFQSQLFLWYNFDTVDQMGVIVLCQKQQIYQNEESHGDCAG